MVSLNIVWVALMLTADVFYSINQENVWCKWLGSVCVLAMGIGCLIFALKYRKDRKFHSIFMLSAVAMVILADMIIFNSIAWGLIVYSIALTLMIVSFLCISRFEWIDLIYSGCVALPLISLVIFAPIFGFANIGVEIGVILYVLLLSCMVGKSIANAFRSKKTTELMTVIASIIFVISNFLILCNSFSYVSHFILIVYVALQHISLSLFASSIYAMAIRNGVESEERLLLVKSVKTGMKPMVAVLMMVLLVSYSTVITFRDLNLASPKVSAEQFYTMMGDNLNIPVIEINTEHNTTPLSKEDYVNASFKISNCASEEDNFSVDMKDNYGDEDSVGIRLRGNSTRLARKRPYRIKFDKKKSLLGMKKNKSWVLLADYYDQSYLRNYVAFSIADEMDNMTFSSTPNHVALILNGNFQGLFLLCEQIDEKEGRVDVEEDFDVNVDKEFPFLVEMDVYAYKEGVSGVDNFNVPYFKPVEIKYPESDERGRTDSEDKVFDYINEYINAVFTTLRTGEDLTVTFRDNPVRFEDLVDIDSAVDYYLMYEIMYSPDQNGLKSVYMNKTKDGKMQFGPIWDFDWSMASGFEVPYKESGIETAGRLVTAYSPIFNRLLRNPEFYQKVSARFNETKDRILEVSDNLKAYKNTIDAVASLDAKCWHGVTGQFQYDMQYDYVRLYLQDRYDFLDNTFNLSHSDFCKWL